MQQKRRYSLGPVQQSKRRKRSSSQDGGTGKGPPGVDHAVISAYYPRLLSLKDFLLSRLPPTSRVRRRKILALGDSAGRSESSFLDTTLVGVLQVPKPSVEEARRRDFATFSQTQQRLSTNSRRSGPCCDIGEVVDFVVWLFFHKSASFTGRQAHILCHGFQKDVTAKETEKIETNVLGIAGVLQRHQNDSIEALKKQPWTEMMPLLGESGESIMQSLLLDCGTFIKLSKGMDNYYQLSGIPIFDLSPLRRSRSQDVAALDWKSELSGYATTLHKPGSIAFVRSRMLYANPSLNAHGSVKFGMKHIQVLNRYPNPHDGEDTLHVLKYVFPRQFGLHNVFTSHVGKGETNQAFKDYTLREIEIAEIISRKGPVKLPKRLRGKPFALVRSLQRQHHHGAYTQLLRFYCSATSHLAGLPGDIQVHQTSHYPESSGSFVTQLSFKCPEFSVGERGRTEASGSTSTPITDYATPVSRVSAFCQAVIRRLLPGDALGSGADGHHNMKLILESISSFVRKRRFETLTLHQVCQSIRVTCIDWLRPRSIEPGAHMSHSDKTKRLEILHEFFYFIFDSILIPLIRTNFYVTESSAHGKRLFYFRHDVWRKISEPSLVNLRLRMFEPLTPQTTRKILGSRTLGYGQVRLLPKVSGTRTIVNLRRQTLKRNNRGKTSITSVNKQLSGVFDMLKYEQQHQPLKLGSALFSIGGMHERLKVFKNDLSKSQPCPLYFVKVDIRSCFDTIPQEKLIAMVEQLISEDQYSISTYCELKPSHDRIARESADPSRRFVQRAVPASRAVGVLEAAASDTVCSKKSVVLADTGRQQVWQSRALVKLLREHVQNNIVKLGKKHCRQRNGIPQGSVLSSLLCSFFYGQFEREHLSFLDAKTSVLLRLIDDFLLITSKEHIARRFLEVMAEGMPSYGISVNPSKSLTNFEVSIAGSKIQRHHGTSRFPYCGMAIDVKTLEVSKDRDKKDLQIRNTLTVETDRKQGQIFRRRILIFLKIQMHPVLLDSTYNSSIQVMSSLFENFTETAIKLHQYSASLPRHRRPNQDLIMDVTRELIALATNLVRSKFKHVHSGGHAVSSSQVMWLGAGAFEQVFRRKQSGYKLVLTWLAAMRESAEAATKLDAQSRDRVLESGAAFKDYVF